MLNLPLFLKCRKNASASRGVSLLVFSAFAAGWVLFFIFGAKLFENAAFDFSISHFSIALSLSFICLMLSAFSQLGLVLASVCDAVLEFLICGFAYYKLGQFSSEGLSMLCIELFALIILAMLLSQRAALSSARLLSSGMRDTKLRRELLLNTAVFSVLSLILVIICLKAL